MGFKTGSEAYAESIQKNIDDITARLKTEGSEFYQAITVRILIEEISKLKTKVDSNEKNN